MTGPLRIVALADTDSYVKWAAALIGALDDGWDARLLIVDTPLVVSASQRDAALEGSGLSPERVERVTYAALASALASMEPDVVLLAGRGPLVRVLAKDAAALHPRPVIVTGLPGISIPATRRALVYRSQSDLFVVHSHRERRAFAEIAAAADGALPERFGLAALPFAVASDTSHEPGADLVFAAQAKVPAERSDRLRIARMLMRAASADPSRRVVVKLRAQEGEHQTHIERDSYPSLLAELGQLPPNLVMSAEPMARALDSADGLVTVSSTAAIEAIARGIPVILLDTFGVSPAHINVVFEGAGVFGGESEMVAREYRVPEPSWRHENYFHPDDDSDWARMTAALVAQRRAGSLAPRPPRVDAGGALREAWDRKVVLGAGDRSLAGVVALVVGTPVRALVRVRQRVRRALRPEAPSDDLRVAGSAAGA